MKYLNRRLSYLIAFIFLFTSIYFIPFADLINYLEVMSQKYPITASFLYVFLVIVGTVLFLPGSISMMISGYLFGFFQGVFLTIIGISFGAQAAFEFGRRAARPWVKKKIESNKYLQAIEIAIEEKSFVIIILTRLSLIIPFNILNYIYGSTSVKSLIHLLATFIGMLPAIMIYVYLGTFARDINQIISNEATPPELGNLIIFIGIFLMFFTAWVIHKAASNILKKYIND